MGKLYELLSVEPDLKNAAKKLIDECIVTFNKKAHHFMGHTKRIELFDADAPQEADEHAEIVDTVDDRLEYLLEYVGKYYDAYLQKEQTNQEAWADLIVNGITIAERLPATFLLGMEEKLKTLRRVYESIPTLKPGIIWEEDSSQRPGVFRAKYDDEKFRTAKRLMHKILVEPTDKHPAQIEKWTEDTKVGRIKTTNWCSMLTPADKAARLGRIDELLIAVKQARQKANDIVAENRDISLRIFEFINKGV